MNLNDLIKEKLRIKNIIQGNKKTNLDFYGFNSFLVDCRDYYYTIKKNIKEIIYKSEHPINSIKREWFKRRAFFRYKSYDDWKNYKMFDKKIGDAEINEDFLELIKNHCAGLYPRCRLLSVKKIKQTEYYTFYRAKIHHYNKKLSGSGKRTPNSDFMTERHCWICVLNGTQTFSLSYHRYLDNKTIKYLIKVAKDKFIKRCVKNIT